MLKKIKLLFWKNQKVDEVEEDQAFVSSKKHKNDKDRASTTSTKKFTQLTKRRNQGKTWLRNPTNFLSPQKYY